MQQQKSPSMYGIRERLVANSHRQIRRNMGVANIFGEYVHPGVDTGFLVVGGGTMS